MPKDESLNLDSGDKLSKLTVEKETQVINQIKIHPAPKKPRSRRLASIWTTAFIIASPIGLYTLVPYTHGIQASIVAKQQAVVDKKIAKQTTLPAVSSTVVCPMFADNALGSTTETTDAESFTKTEVGGILLSAPASEPDKATDTAELATFDPKQKILESLALPSPSKSAAALDKTMPKQARSAWDQTANNQLLDKFGLRFIWVEPKWSNGKELTNSSAGKGNNGDPYWLGNVADRSINILSQKVNLTGQSTNLHPVYLRLNPQITELKKDPESLKSIAEISNNEQRKENETNQSLERVQNFSVESQRSNLAGVGSFARSDQGAMYSIAAATCQIPQMLSYLVGGSTTAGNSTRLLVHNPQTTAVTVQVEGYGSAGLLELGGAGRLVIPPKSTSNLLIESFVDEPQIAFKILSKGGPVVAWLQVQEANGLATRGTDLVVAGANLAAHQQIITGVVGSDSSYKTINNSNSVTDGTISNVAARNAAGALETPVLRLVNPNSKDLTARISVYGGNGRINLPGNDQLKVESESVLDVPLTGLQSGYYSVQVDCDQAVLAAVKISSRPTIASTNSNVLADTTTPSKSINSTNLGKTAIVSTGENSDLTWLAPSQTQSVGLLAVNTLATQNMAIFTNPASQEVHLEITAVGTDRKTQVAELTIPAEGTRALWIPSSARGLLFAVKSHARLAAQPDLGVGVSAQLLSMQSGAGGLMLSNLSSARDWKQSAGQVIYLWK